MIATDLSKQQALDADPGAIPQISFTTNLDRARNRRIYFILEKAKETNCLRLFTKNCKSFVNTIPLSDLLFISIK